MAVIVLATCQRWPALLASDAELARALAARGHTAVAAPWNGPFEPFVSAELVVIRATWDYAQDVDAYRDWLSRVSSDRVVVNDPALVGWNLDKRYLTELAGRGVKVLPSAVVESRRDHIASVMRARGWSRAVVKPLVGASGDGVALVGLTTSGDVTGVDALRPGPVLVQEYAAEIANDGELAGVFFDGAFSHGLRRVPRRGEFRVNSQYGGTTEACSLRERTIRAMALAIGALPAPPVYARIDGVERHGELVVLEVEVNEPGLGLDLVPGAADRFAAALDRVLRDRRGG